MRALLIDLLVAFGATGILVLDGLHRVHTPPFWVPAVAVAFVVLLLRRRYPLITAFIGYGLAWFVPTVLLLPTVLLYTVASRRGPKWPTAVAVAGCLALLATFAGSGGTPNWRALGVSAVSFLVIPVLAGLWMYQRAALLEALRGRADQAERERDLLAERAVAAERRRIAREMHDVVAHRVSIVALQAGALSVRAPDEETGQLAEVIRESSAAALNELRDILQVLRDDAPDPSSRPGPALSGVARLTGDLAAAGARIVTDLPEPLPRVTDQVGRAAYRIVQESLTNAAKHAPGATIHVRLGLEDGRLVTEVANPLGASAGLPVSGYGLIGMRERVTLAGGALNHGPDGAGRYVVRASFPAEGGTP
ncbi:histidine kinase [Amycolatopsis sp. PS_44_ISF1]|uniref:sensor histidine kinase n=1 Tax=Amycolatopsis sp. PS_44_ISF1 TaxID=2974917 RepID=UPI0028DFDA09|nr:histidine kinase [Amycolatopsis sp. PS_44_ISF1]MDT8912138.1 histidine kinase [Amycolatopsis sp. PS_44_ISF1]